MQSAMSARLPEALKLLQGRQLADEDLRSDVDSLASALETYTKTQTTFDAYAAEVRSGRLKWSPPHKDAGFWRENARTILESEKGGLPKLLAGILAKEWSGETAVLAIACSDVAWLVKEVPEQKVSLEKLGIKARLIELMQSGDESVRWESLRAVGEWLRYSSSS